LSEHGSTAWALVADLLERRFGFAVDVPAHRDGLVARLRRRAEGMAFADLDDYLRQLALGPDRDAELDALRGLVTNNETYFFREPDQLELMAEELVPELDLAAGQPLRLLSAGCSSGEEVYSAAIALDEAGNHRPVAIDGCDLNPRRIHQARTALYAAGALRATDPARAARYFVEQDGRYQLRPRHRRGVRFFEQNLIEPGPFPGPASYEIVLCRNVLIYFSARARQRALDQLVRWLVPGGYLLLGHAESLLEPRGDLIAVGLDRGVVYRKEAR
jgi:chemotaxis protein methyltransferase CheR